MPVRLVYMLVLQARIEAKMQTQDLQPPSLETWESILVMTASSLDWLVRC